MTIISNVQLPEDPSLAVEFLENCKEISFTLVGSRRFGTATDKSDWDFYTQYSKETEALLRKKGFSRTMFYDYGDLDVVIVYRLLDVDIQLRRDPALYELVCEEIESMGVPFYEGLHKMDRPSRTKVWNFLLRMKASGLDRALLHLG